MIKLIFVFSIIFNWGLIDGERFHEECRETLKHGKLTVERVADLVASNEVERLQQVVDEAKHRAHHPTRNRMIHSNHIQSILKINKNDDEPPCPNPNSTMFTTSTPSTTTTKATTTTASASSQTSASPLSSSPASTSSPSSGSTSSPTSASTSSSASSSSSSESRFRSIYSRDYPDIFSNYMSTLHYYMNRHEEVCNNKIDDLNSITEDQLYGYFSTLAAAHPGPFCSLCHRFTEEVHNRVLRPNQLLIMDDDHHISHLLYSHFPSSKTICSAIAPGCHENYADKVFNLTDSVICLECTACMSITNVIQHKILLQPDVIDKLYGFLRGNLFHNICAELCWAFNGKNLTIFPHGFTYDGCQSVFKTKYYQLVKFATVLLRPERFCSLEIQWCELNEQPNAVHCLRELCQEYFSDTPQTKWLCSQIPDNPQKADAFLNIKQTKIVKDKKEYHIKFEESRIHDEL